MSLLALLEGQVSLHARAGALVVERDGVQVQTLQPHEITEVQVHGGAQITAAARRLLLKEGVDVAFLARDGRFEGRLVSAVSRQGARRLAQYRFTADPLRALGLARALVASKVANQRALLLARQHHLRKERIGDALAAMRALLSRVEGAADADQLRGLEGMAARHYFQGFGACVTNGAFLFTERNRRPPRDPINACLSFGYGLLVSQVDAAVRAAGVDPHLGVLHSAERGAPALTLDLAEEFRPFVDGVVLNLVNRRQLSPEDFRPPTAEELGDLAETVLAAGSGGNGAGGEVNAVYMGEVGRSILIRAWEARLQDRVSHPARDEMWTLRALLLEQARQAARVFESNEAAPGWKPARMGD